MSEWLDDVEPFDPERSHAQIAALRARLSAGQRVLDIGSGDGRVLRPLRDAGVDVLGIERNAEYVKECIQASASTEGAVRCGSFPDALTESDAAFDAILLLGNVLMTYPDVDDAVALLTAARQRLAPGGEIIIDDVAADFWPELIEGYWLSGTSDDELMQFVWDRTDSIFTIRMADRVDPDHDELREDDVRYRLWTRGALALLARAAGLSAPEVVSDGGLLVLRGLDD